MKKKIESEVSAVMHASLTQRTMYMILLITLLCKSAHQSYKVELCQVIYLQNKYIFHFDLNDITMTMKRDPGHQNCIKSMGEALKTKLYCHDKTE